MSQRSLEEFGAYRAWKVKQKRPTLSEQFAEIRAILAAEGEDGIEIPPRTTRYNPMVDDPHYWDDEPEPVANTAAAKTEP